jgi:hypothetical protein
MTSNDLAQDVELPRATRTKMLYGPTRNGAVRYRFDDAIDALHDDGGAVTVRFRGGDEERFDAVSQIRMPGWSKGRIALVGHAACAPSFRAGQGTSMALVGAYVLVGELAVHDDAVAAFAAYERIVRPYMEANQALVGRDGANMIFPRSREALAARAAMLAAMAAALAVAARGGAFRDAETAHIAIVLRDYP